MKCLPLGEVSLRDATGADIPALYKFQSDRVANKLVGFVPRSKPSFFAHWKKILGDANCEKKVILLDGQVAGYLVCFIREASQREVGYWIGREHWGQGLASAALKLFLRRYRRRPLYARVAKHNAASLKVVQKNGFKIVGEDVFSNSKGEKYDEFILELGGKPRAA